MIENFDNTNMFPTQGRVKQQNLIPTAIKGRQLSTGIIANTSTEISDPTILTTGSSLVVQSIIRSTPNAKVPIGAVPYAIIFFEGSTNTTNIIGVSITGTGYAIKGPQAMPVFSPNAISGVVGGSDGDDLVFYTELYNNTGLTKTIYYITNTRTIQGSGAGVL